jgi:hypothetical protein
MSWHALSRPCRDMPCRAHVVACYPFHGMPCVARRHALSCFPGDKHKSCHVLPSPVTSTCRAMPCHVSSDCSVTSTSRAMACGHFFLCIFQEAFVMAFAFYVRSFMPWHFFSLFLNAPRQGHVGSSCLRRFFSPFLPKPLLKSREREMRVGGERGGTNRSDAGLNLSGSWQQGHSATYNTPSRI